MRARARREQNVSVEEKQRKRTEARLRAYRETQRKTKWHTMCDGWIAQARHFIQVAQEEGCPDDGYCQWQAKVSVKAAVTSNAHEKCKCPNKKKKWRFGVKVQNNKFQDKGLLTAVCAEALLLAVLAAAVWWLQRELKRQERQRRFAEAEAAVRGTEMRLAPTSVERMTMDLLRTGRDLSHCQ